MLVIPDGSGLHARPLATCCQAEFLEAFQDANVVGEQHSCSQEIHGLASISREAQGWPSFFAQ